MDPTSAIVMLSCIYWGALFGGASPRSCSTSRARRGRSRPPSTAIRWRNRRTGRGAHRRLHVVLHRLVRGGDAHHVPRPRIADFALRFGPPEFFAVYLLTFCSFVGLAARSATRSSSPWRSACSCRHRHGYGLGPAAHDLRLDRSPARRQLPRRRDRPLRHQRDPADDGGAPRPPGPRRQDQPASSGRPGRPCHAIG